MTITQNGRSKGPLSVWKFFAIVVSLTIILLLFYNGVLNAFTLVSEQHMFREGKMRILQVPSAENTSTSYPGHVTTESLREREFNYTPIVTEEFDCRRMLDGDQDEIARSKTFSKEFYRNSISNTWYFVKTKNCDRFIRERGYVIESLTSEERDFPIAYSILMFKDVEQFERLLRAIYRPQNYYCVHVDAKAKEDVYNAVRGIVGCFDNVFLTRKYVDVQWGTFTVLEPELICMKQLFRYKRWKYFINLTGQEFPLKTNLEIVRILKAYNGANDIEGTVKRANKGRWAQVGVKPPHNIRPVKGSIHIVVNRGFVDYVLHNQTALDFREWVKKVDVPDETFFSSLNHNPQLGIPGSYKGLPETNNTSKPFLARFKNWGGEPFNWPCHGKRVRLICIFGVGDLPLLSRRKELFANKFYLDFEPFTLDCMEEDIYNRTRDQYLYSLDIDTKYYQSLGFVKNKV